MGNFTMQPTHKCLKMFMEMNGNLIKNNTYLIGQCSCIILIFTNKKYYFKYSISHESDTSLYSIFYTSD